MLRYMNQQDRGSLCSEITKAADGTLIFKESKIERPNIVIEVTDQNIFFPYPEKDVIQNPLLKQDPQPYNFQ